MRRNDDISSEGFTRVPNALIADQRVSLAAKAVWAYIASKPASWTFRRDAMCRQLGICRTYLQKLCNELIAAGWLEREQVIKGKGFKPATYRIKSPNVDCFNVHVANVHATNVHVDMGRNSNTNISNTDISKTKDSDALSKKQKIDSFKQQAKEAGRELGLTKNDVFKFFTYWTQPGKSGGLLYEDKSSFDVEARLKLWIANER